MKDCWGLCENESIKISRSFLKEAWKYAREACINLELDAESENTATNNKTVQTNFKIITKYNVLK